MKQWIINKWYNRYVKYDIPQSELKGYDLIWSEQ